MVVYDTLLKQKLWAIYKCKRIKGMISRLYANVIVPFIFIRYMQKICAYTWEFTCIFYSTKCNIKNFRFAFKILPEKLFFFLFTFSILFVWICIWAEHYLLFINVQYLSTKNVVNIFLSFKHKRNFRRDKLLLERWCDKWTLIIFQKTQVFRNNRICCGDFF